MAVVYSADVKDDRMQIVADAIDAGAGPGKLEIGTAGMASVLATVALADPCGAVLAGVLTFDFPQSDIAADASGTAAAARIRDSNNNDVVTGLTVGTGGGSNIVVNSTTVTLGQTVTINSGIITHG